MRINTCHFHLAPPSNQGKNIKLFSIHLPHILLCLFLNYGCMYILSASNTSRSKALLWQPIIPVRRLAAFNIISFMSLWSVWWQFFLLKGIGCNFCPCLLCHTFFIDTLLSIIDCVCIMLICLLIFLTTSFKLIVLPDRITVLELKYASWVRKPGGSSSLPRWGKNKRSRFSKCLSLSFCSETRRYRMMQGVFLSFTYPLLFCSLTGCLWFWLVSPSWSSSLLGLLSSSMWLWSSSLHIAVEACDNLYCDTKAARHSFKLGIIWSCPVSFQIWCLPYVNRIFPFLLGNTFKSNKRNCQPEINRYKFLVVKKIVTNIEIDKLHLKQHVSE